MTVRCLGTDCRCREVTVHPSPSPLHSSCRFGFEKPVFLPCSHSAFWHMLPVCGQGGIPPGGLPRQVGKRAAGTHQGTTLGKSTWSKLVLGNQATHATGSINH